MNHYAALRYRLKALELSWLSTSNWKYYDAYSTSDESIRRGHLLEAHAYEVCAGNLERLLDELPSHLQIKSDPLNEKKEE